MREKSLKLVSPIQLPAAKTALASPSPFSLLARIGWPRIRVGKETSNEHCSCTRIVFTVNLTSGSNNPNSFQNLTRSVNTYLDSVTKGRSGPPLHS